MELREKQEVIENKVYELVNDSDLTLIECAEAINHALTVVLFAIRTGAEKPIS